MNPVQMSKESAALPTHAGRASSALSLLGAPRTRLAAASLARHYQADFTCVRGSQKRERASEEARREASGARRADRLSSAPSSRRLFEPGAGAAVRRALSLGADVAWI